MCGSNSVTRFPIAEKVAWILSLSEALEVVFYRDLLSVDSFYSKEVLNLPGMGDGKTRVTSPSAEYATDQYCYQSERPAQTERHTRTPACR